MLIFVLAVQWLLLVIIGIVVVVLAQQIGILHTRLGPIGARVIPEGPPLGSQIGPLKVALVNGGEIVIGQGGAAPQLLVFTAPDCSACARLAPALRTFGRDNAQHRIVIISTADSEAAATEFVNEHRLGRFPLVLATDLPPDLVPSGAPFVVHLDETGQVLTKGITNSYEHLESLLSTRGLEDAPLQKQ